MFLPIGGRPRPHNWLRRIAGLTSGIQLAQAPFLFPQCDSTPGNTIVMGPYAFPPSPVAAYNSIAIGASALGTPQQSGSIFNTAIGFEALAHNTSGSYNTGLGPQALYSCTTGTNNYGIGYEASYSLTTGLYNIAIGFQALYYNNSNYNMALGYQAMLENISGTQNAAIGFQAGYNNLGTGNTFIGYQSGLGAAGMNGAQNVCIGLQTGVALTSGGNNTFLGYSAGATTTSGSNNIVIGYNQNAPAATSSNTLNIGGAITGTGLGGTVAITINGSLIVTTHPASFQAQPSSTANMTVTTPTTVALGTVNFNNGSNFSSNTWTPPAGIVSLHASVVSIDPAGVENAVTIGIYNGVTLLASATLRPTATAQTQAGTISCVDSASGSSAYTFKASYTAISGAGVPVIQTSSIFSGTLII